MDLSRSPLTSQRPLAKWWPLALYVALLALSFAACGAAYAFVPEWRAQLVLEDAWIENLSLVFYLFGVGILALGLHSCACRFGGMGVLAGLCFIGILEEISYGQRFFPGLPFPTLPNGMTLDALHDFSRVAVLEFLKLGVPGYAGFALSVLLPLAVVAWLLRRRLRAILEAILAPHSVWLYVTSAAGLALIALFIDSRGSISQSLVFLEEVLEMNAALSLAFAAGIGVFFAHRTPLKG